MLLMITSTLSPATDLGYVLHKHPDRHNETRLASGTAHVFYPVAAPERCTAALLVEVDPIALARDTRRRDFGAGLGHYVNDRPYAASSMLAVALAQVFRTAMRGRCDARPDLAARPIPLELTVPALPCRGGPELAGRLFGPLGWRVDAEPLPLDPDGEGVLAGASPYVRLRLRGEVRVADALNHLYVLLPVLDDGKHYWVTTDEVDKLVRAGTGWLAGHPDRELIAHRYLAHRRGLTEDAVARLAATDDMPEEALDDGGPAVTGTPGSGRPLAAQRVDAVVDALRAAGARSVVDLGCGEGRLLAALLADPAFERITGADASVRSLEKAKRRLRLDGLSDTQRARVTLLQTALTYRDPRLRGYDAAVLMEVVEHVDPPRLAALAHTVLGDAHPGTVVVTTPNAEYNVRFPELSAGAMRHRDHRFEWTREQFRNWVRAVADRFGYTAAFGSVGDDDPAVGPPTQLAVLSAGGDRD